MRRKDREITEAGEILAVIGRAKILHLGLFDDGYPYIVPLHFGCEYADGNLVFYMHCAQEGHKLDLIRNDPRVCVEMSCDAELISGGDDPCRYASYYASVIGRGCAEIVTDPAEKQKGLALLMKHQTGRDFVFNAQTVSAVAVVKVTVTEYTAKARMREN